MITSNRAGLARAVAVSLAVSLSVPLAGCGGEAPRFALRAPVWRDLDLTPISLPCRPAPTPKDPRHVSCAPEEYVSPLAWDAADNTVFRPLSHFFKADPGGEAPNVNALDEAPDSAWFTNRLSRRQMTADELRLGACQPDQILDGESAEPGSWVIDHGKDNGASPGFRIKVKGKGKYLLKADSKEQPERPSAASVIGSAVYHAAGFYTSCEQVVYFKKSALKLTPGLSVTNNLGVTRPFDEKALEKVFAETTKRGEYIRMQASAWLPGKPLGPFRYEKRRDDDPNDRIDHDDRRDLRGGRLVAAWLDHFDAREQNTMDSWITVDKKADPDASPGFVRHYYLDTSDCLGSEWDWDEVSKRLGHSYLFDFDDVGADFITFGVPERPWDRAKRSPGNEIFGYFAIEDFDGSTWKNEYPNPTFSRMTEHDGAWMARILARFTPEMVTTLADMGRFTSKDATEHLRLVLEGRLEQILSRYLTKLSPIGELRVDGKDKLCGVDLARLRKVRDPSTFRYGATLGRAPADPAARPVAVTPGVDGAVCATLPHVAADGGVPDSHASRYVVVTMTNGVAEGPLEAHLYDLGPQKGYRLVGVVRP
jgi:hypothetical protein